MRIFFDTNVLVAAFIAHGVCGELFEHCLTEHTIYISNQVVDELHNVLIQKLKFPKNLSKRVISFVEKHSVVITKSSLSSPVCRDPDDDAIIGAAISAKVDCLITGDKDLLILKEVQKIPTVKPLDFWKFERKKME
jgi:putative PIN family toxin of toxin-antitoxin system